MRQHQVPQAMVEDFVVESPCGHCGQSMDLASNHRGKKPKPGDLGVCWSCAGVNRYGEGLRLERVTDSELERLDGGEYDGLERLEELRALIRAATTRSYERGGEA